MCADLPWHQRTSVVLHEERQEGTKSLHVKTFGTTRRAANQSNLFTNTCAWCNQSIEHLQTLTSFTTHLPRDKDATDAQATGLAVLIQTELLLRSAAAATCDFAAPECRFAYVL